MDKNILGSVMKITEYQALNILVAKYKDNATQRERFNKIRALLLSTEKSPEDIIIMAELFRDVALTQYEIISDHSTSLFTPEQMQQIEQAIENQIKANKSGGNIVLSVGESLLMVINACKKQKVDVAIIAQLKVLYLDGVKSENDKKFITTINNSIADTKLFTVSTDPKELNADSTRRYFETHLSYHLLKSKAEGLDIKQIRTFNENLKSNLWNVLADKTKIKADIDYILNGVMHPSLNKYQLEYAEMINKLKSHNYHGFSAKACDNLCEIAKSTILATLNTQHDKYMPADIYEHSIFTMGMDGRGRIIKRTHDDVRTGAKGIMRSTSPLPYGDIVRDGDTEQYEVPLYEDQLDEFGEPVLDQYGKIKRIPAMRLTKDLEDIVREVPVTALRERIVVSPFQRSADQANFMMESQWCQHLFGRQTHVYANGISSTTLATLRSILMEKREGNPCHEEYFEDFMLVFAALMIYNSGGHSLFEIFEVFKLPQLNEIMDAANCSKLLKNDELMQQWFIKDHPKEFDKSLDESIEYLEQLLKRRALNAQFTHWAKDDGTLHSHRTLEIYDVRKQFAIENSVESTPSGLSLHQAVLTLSAAEFKRRVNATKNLKLDVLNSSGYTPLMVAAQLGLLGHVKALVEKGADLTKEFERGKNMHGLTALELAIKSEKYPVVKYLLRLPGMYVKHNESSIDRFDIRSLRDRAPALYFACRQTDIRITKAVVKSDSNISLSDKILAIQECVKFENIDNALELIALLTRKELISISLKEKQKILKMAAGRGNALLLGKLMDSPIAPVQAYINYDEMVIKASEHGYLPIVRLLLREALHKETLPKNSILNKMMLTALSKGKYDLAVLFIAYGADPDKIGITNRNLEQFTHYLRTTPPEHYNTFFSAIDRLMISDRADSLKEKYKDRTTGIWRTCIDLLVAFLNALPLVNLGGYYQKTEVITRLSFQVITNEEPKKDYEIGYGELPKSNNEYLEDYSLVEHGTKMKPDSRHINVSRAGIFSVPTAVNDNASKTDEKNTQPPSPR